MTESKPMTESMVSQTIRKRASVAQAELCHAVSQLAEALAYGNMDERDPQRNLKRVLQHLDTARANLAAFR